MGRNYVPELIFFVYRMCKYLVKHRTKIDAILTTVLSGSELATVTAWLNGVQAVCDILQAHKASF